MNRKKIILLSATVIFLFVMMAIAITMTIKMIPKKQLSQNIKDVKLVYSSDAIVQKKGELRLDVFSLDVVFENDSIERKIVTSDMISKTDYASLQEVGIHSITILYASFQINVDICIYDNLYLTTQKVYLTYNEGSYRVSEKLEIDTTNHENKYFSGWYLDKELTKEYIENDNEKGIIQLYPFWSNTPTYKVTFMLNSKVVLKEQRVPKGSSAVPPMVENTSNLVFVGWDHSYNHITEDIVIYAIFTGPMIDVYFLGLHDQEIGHLKVEKGSSISNFPTPPVVDGYQFVGWNSEGKNISTTTYIRAKYLDYSTELVKYYNDDGSLLYTLPVGERPTTHPIKEGYSFSHWEYRDACFYAVYTECSSTIKLHFDDVGLSDQEIKVYKNSIVFLDKTWKRLPNNFISYFTLTYVSNIWYTDEEQNQEVDIHTYIKTIQDNDLFDQYFELYGKKTSTLSYDETAFTYDYLEELDAYEAKMNPNYEPFNYGDGYIYLSVPHTYNYKPVVKLTYLNNEKYGALTYFAIPNTVSFIQFHTSYACIVATDSPYYESYKGCLLDRTHHAISYIPGCVNDDFIVEKICIQKREDVKGNYNTLGKNCISNEYTLNHILHIYKDIKIEKGAFSNIKNVNICFLGLPILEDVSSKDVTQLLEEPTNYFGFKGHIDGTITIQVEQKINDDYLKLIATLLNNNKQNEKITYDKEGLEVRLLHSENVIDEQYYKTLNMWLNYIKTKVLTSYQQIQVDIKIDLVTTVTLYQNEKKEGE